MVITRAKHKEAVAFMGLLPLIDAPMEVKTLWVLFIDFAVTIKREAADGWIPAQQIRLWRLYSGYVQRVKKGFPLFFGHLSQDELSSINHFEKRIVLDSSEEVIDRDILYFAIA